MKAFSIVGASTIAVALSGVVRAQETPTPAEQLNQAAELRLQLQWEAALTLLRQVVGRRAEDELSAAMAQARIGQYLVAMGRPADAVPELLRVTSEFPNQRQALRWSQVWLTDAYLYQNQFESAQATADNLHNTSAQEPEFAVWARLKSAEIALARGQREPALSAFQQVIDDPSGPFAEPTNWARVRMAEILTYSGLVTEAVQTCDQIISEHATGQAGDEQAAWALLWKARALKSQERYEEAAQALQMSSALADGKYPQPSYCASFELGEVHRLSGDGLSIQGGGGALHAEALGHYQAALQKAVDYRLPESEQDLARLQVGSEIRHLGARAGGIAWLRQGIVDPAELSQTDALLSERLSSFMFPQESEAWYRFLADPATSPDPTRGFVEAEFGSPPAAIAAGVMNNVSTRMLWLGRFYREQQRLPEARASFEVAVQMALSDLEKAEALAALALCLAPIEGTQAARAYADAAQPFWLNVINTDCSAGKVHYAIQSAVRVYADLKLFPEALNTANFILTQPACISTKSHEAFATYMQVRALAWQGRLASAIRAATAFNQAHQEDSDVDVQTILVGILLMMADYQAQARDPDAALATIDSVEQRFPNVPTAWLTAHRKICQRIAERQGSNR